MEGEKSDGGRRNREDPGNLANDRTCSDGGDAIDFSFITEEVFNNLEPSRREAFLRKREQEILRRERARLGRPPLMMKLHPSLSPEARAMDWLADIEMAENALTYFKDSGGDDYELVELLRSHTGYENNNRLRGWYLHLVFSAKLKSASDANPLTTFFAELNPCTKAFFNCHIFQPHDCPAARVAFPCPFASEDDDRRLFSHYKCRHEHRGLGAS